MVRYEPNPKHLDGVLKLLRFHSRRVSRRQGPDRRAGQKPSKRWEKANRERNKIHHRVANRRTDALHKLTTRIRDEYGTVVVENLNVAGMLRNKRLARRVADASFGEIRRQLTYKGQWNGCHTVVADRWYPSSKICSACGAVKTKLPLHVRVFTCDVCGLVLDRDANAARNLAALAAACATGTGVAGDQDTPRVSKPRGADRKTRRQRPDRTSTEAGGQVAQPCRTSDRQKREIVVRTPKPSASVTPARTFSVEMPRLLRGAVKQFLSNGYREESYIRSRRRVGMGSGSRTALVEDLMERFPHVPREAVFKEDLLRGGVAFDPSALSDNEGGEVKPKSYFIFSFDHGTLPELARPRCAGRPRRSSSPAARTTCAGPSSRCG